MKLHHILPVIALLLLGSAPVMAHDAAPDKPRAEKSLADMWDHKGGKQRGAPDREAMQEEREKLKSLSGEERAKYMKERAAERKAEMIERIERLPPEKQAEARKRMEEFEARREKMRKELMDLPPEQREARMKEINKDMRAEYRAKRTAHFNKKWDAANEEERAAFCAKMVVNCKGGEDDPRLCELAKSKCKAP